MVRLSRSRPDRSRWANKHDGIGARRGQGRPTLDLVERYGRARNWRGFLSRLPPS